MGELIKITVGNVTKEYEKGVSLQDIAKDFQKDYEYNIVLARTNGRLRELMKHLYEDTNVELITVADKFGSDTYRRSVPFLMLKAYNDICTDEERNKLYICFSLSKGLYCRRTDGVAIDNQMIEKIKKRMLELVKADLPITKQSLNTQVAIDYFRERGMLDKVRLLNYRRVSKTNIYTLDDYKDYFYGFMVPRTGLLNCFDLFKYDEGFVLQMPERFKPDVVPSFEPQNKLFGALIDAEIWADKMEAGSVGALNDTIVNGGMVDLIYFQEALFERKVVETVDKIIQNRDTKVILIAGPSSSGKTTFSHRLAIQLRASGFKPHLVGVDNYFVNREDTPLDENGKYDFECLEAIDIKLLNDDLTKLIKGERVEIPKFDFVLGKRGYAGNYLQLGPNDILILEGIHCLNDKMSYALPKANKFKIYISALTQLNVDEHNRIATTDGRLLRRMARDAKTRGIDAAGTIERWPSVRRGEERHIFPFQEQADVVINSSLIYEISALKPVVEPLLFKVDRSSKEYDEAKRLLKFLDYFLAIDSKYIPNNSIVREFVGDGCFEL